MKAWHFLKDDGSLQWQCGKYRKPKIGQTLKVDPDKLDMCSFGLHASKRIIDALEYAPGATICRVEMGGKIIRGEDKLVASERTIIAMADATETLHRMAIWCAKRALKHIDKPDPRSIAAIEAKEKWLRGEITDDKLNAARCAAWAAAYAARCAAWAAAYAARYAARYAASDAAKAAWGAARGAARYAARYAAYAASAAWYAARCAARDAEREAQNHKLTRMINEIL